MSVADIEDSILLVDDEESVRYLVTAMLEHHGYAPLATGSSPDALELFKRHSTTIKLLLTDVVMPKMSGIELAEELRTISPALKVIYMSGYMAGDIPMRRSGTPDPVILQKPFSSDALLKRVREALV